jgi:hypothetical protein
MFFFGVHYPSIYFEVVLGPTDLSFELFMGCDFEKNRDYFFAEFKVDFFGPDLQWSLLDSSA